MPELPEVESFARALNASYRGRTLKRVLFRRRDLRTALDIDTLGKIFAPGVRFVRFFRDGKQLVIRTSAGEALISLGMSGAFAPVDPKRPKPHEHITFILSGGEAFGFIDPRRFGHVRVRTAPLPHLADPLSARSLIRLFLSPEWRESRRSVKAALLDQHMIGGLGNIYVLESLYGAKIRPTRRVSRIRKSEWGTLSREIPMVLRRAIKAGGSTIATYRGLHREIGTFQLCHRVYGRAGKRCLRPGCSGVIKRITQSGRGSFYCPKCQQ